MANPLKVLGKGISYVGLGTVFLMAIVGSISIDMVIFAALIKESKKRDGNNFLTGYLFGLMWSNNNSSRRGGFYTDAGIMLLISPLLTAVAVALSFALGVPEIGVALIAGWVGAFSIVTLGLAIYSLGDMIEGVFAKFSAWSNEASRTRTYHNDYTRDIPAHAHAHAPAPAQPVPTRNATWLNQPHFSSPIAPPAANDSKDFIARQPSIFRQEQPPPAYTATAPVAEPVSYDQAMNQDTTCAIL